MKRRLLWIGDAVASTGFSRITHGVCDVLKDKWEVHVLGINYHGDPHEYPYPIWPARGLARADLFGVTRTAPLTTRLKPEVIIVLNDPWNVPAYMKKAGNCPVIASMAVDGLNCRGQEINGLMHAIFWTEFGASEAARGGYKGDSTVIPLGVDIETFTPGDRVESRAALRLPPRIQRDAFIVGNINRNQPRKRLDLTIQYFATWIRKQGIEDAYLYLHVAPTGEEAYDLNNLAKFYGVASRLIMASPEIGVGVDEEYMVHTYRAFDVQMTTTQGEGFGLTTLEGMACGIPQIVPDWAALGEICRDHALLVPCSSTATTQHKINAIGGIGDMMQTIECLDRLYRTPGEREELSRAGILLAGKACYRWPDIGRRYLEVIETALDPTMGVIRVGEDETGRLEGDGAQAQAAR